MDLPQQHPGLGHGTGSGTFPSPYGPLRTSNTAGGYPNAIHSTFDMNPAMGYGPTRGGAGEIGGLYGYGHAAPGGGGGRTGCPLPQGGNILELSRIKPKRLCSTLLPGMVRIQNFMHLNNLKLNC